MVARRRVGLYGTVFLGRIPYIMYHTLMLRILYHVLSSSQIMRYLDGDLNASSTTQDLTLGPLLLPCFVHTTRKFFEKGGGLEIVFVCARTSNPLVLARCESCAFGNRRHFPMFQFRVAPRFRCEHRTDIIFFFREEPSDIVRGRIRLFEAILDRGCADGRVMRTTCRAREHAIRLRDVAVPRHATIASCKRGGKGGEAHTVAQAKRARHGREEGGGLG